MKFLPRFLSVSTFLASLLIVSVGLLWIRNESLRPVTPSASPNWVAVVENPDPFRSKRQFQVERSKPADLSSNTWEGTVTRVNIEQGSKVAEETPAPLAIDGLDRPWFLSPEPLYRSIGSGDVGPDVDAVASFLNSAGHSFSHTPSTEVGSSFETAIEKWATKNGFGKEQTRFDPSWVAWAPSDLKAGEISEVKIKVGAPAPSTNESYAVVGSVPTSIQEVSSEDIQPLDIEGTQQNVEIGGDLQAFQNQELDDTGLTLLRENLDPAAETVQLPVVYEYPDEAAIIPPSALETTDDSYCVTVSENADGLQPTTQVVSTFTSAPGIAVVKLDKKFGYVLANPGSVDQPSSC